MMKRLNVYLKEEISQQHNSGISGHGRIKGLMISRLRDFLRISHRTEAQLAKSWFHAIENRVQDTQEKRIEI